MRPRVRFGGIIVLVAILMLLPITPIPPFFHITLVLYFVFITLAQSWNLLGGYSGLLNLGHSAFFGLGVVAGGLAITHGVPIYAALVIGGATAAGLGIVVSPTFRLRADYFAIGTLVLPAVVRPALENLTGIHEIIIPTERLLLVTTNYYVGLGMMLASLTILYLLISSRYGVALRSMRDDEDAARALGVNVFRLKLFSMVASGFFAGVAGGFYASYLGFISPSDVFGLNFTLTPLFMTLLGGAGTFVGPIVGAIVFAGLSQLLTSLLPGSNLDLLAFSALIIFIAVAAPRGLVPLVQRRFVRATAPIRTADAAQS